MRNLELTDIPEDLFERIRRNAQSHKCSVNSEILSCLLTQLVQPDANSTHCFSSSRNLLSTEELHALLAPEDNH